uniref:Gelsolin-like domain-containing protein n=1 Tax=Panagrellus redivivus TaxID=6233 RepID=A0A7E5A135_PANRE
MRPPPVKLGKTFYNGFSDVKNLRPDVHDHVLVTDNHHAYLWASKETFLFRVFKLLHKIAVFRFLLDGIGDVNPIWHAVIRADDIIYKKQQIYVKETLVLYCDSTDAYEKIIPYISGPYFRLILHGNVNVDQVKRLINPNVMQVRISAKMDLLEQDYDDFAEFVLKQTSSFSNKWYKFVYFV